MPDLPFLPRDTTLTDRIAGAFDPEGKIVRAIERFADLDGRRVVLLGPAPALEQVLRAHGAAVVATEPSVAVANDAAHVATGLPAASADVVLAPWTGFDGAADAAELGEALRLLVPGGRLLVLQDYGRDDLAAVRGRGRTEHLVSRSRRDGWLLQNGFKVHVIHAWWRFADLADAATTLVAAFGPEAASLAASLRKPVVAHNVAIYHRTTSET